MDFKELYNQIVKKIGHSKPAKESIAIGLSMNFHVVSAMICGKEKATSEHIAAMNEILKRPPYPGYVTVAVVAKHRGCGRQNVHQLIRSKRSIDEPTCSFPLVVWQGDKYREIWEGALHEY